MAGQESLGEAVLTLTVDSGLFEKQVDAAKEYVQRQLGEGTSGGISRSKKVQLKEEATFEQRLARIRSERRKREQKEEERQARTRANTRRGQISSGLIGGAFPLLFGQGPGAAIGGAVGGALGGGPLGFAGSLVGTVLGQSFDQLLQSGTTLATGLKEPVKAFSALQEQSALSSKALEKYAGSLIATGQNAEAAALIQLDALRFGDVSNLEDLADAQDELGRNFAVLGTAMSNFVAGPLARFIEKLNEAIKKGPTAGADGLPEFSDQLEQLKRAQKIRQEGMGLAIGGSAAGLIPGLGLFGGLLAGIGALQVGFANMIEPDMVSDLDEFLKITHKIATARKDINKLSEIEVELIRGASAERTKELKLDAARIAYNQELEEAGKDLVLIAKAERNFKKETAQIEADYRAAALASANKEIARIEKLNAAYGRLLNSRIKLEAAPVFGETDTARVVMQAGASVASARVDEMMARRAVEAAQRRLLNAQMFGTADDVSDAANDVRVAMMDAETAATNVKVSLKEAANSILTNVQAAATRLRDATRSLRDLRLGNLRFLPREQRQRLIREQVQRGLPEARRRGVALRGLEDLFSFNRFIEQERGGRQTLADAERNMVEANESLRNEMIRETGALTQLTTVMERLIDKSWAVYVNVPSQNAASALNMANQLN